jgi:hypothetical protein
VGRCQSRALSKANVVPLRDVVSRDRQIASGNMQLSSFRHIIVFLKPVWKKPQYKNNCQAARISCTRRSAARSNLYAQPPLRFAFRSYHIDISCRLAIIVKSNCFISDITVHKDSVNCVMFFALYDFCFSTCGFESTENPPL